MIGGRTRSDHRASARARLASVLLAGTVAVAGCGLLGPEESHFHHEIRLDLQVVGADGVGVPSSVRVVYSSPRDLINTPEGLQTKFAEIASGATNGEGLVQFQLSHEVPEPPCCHTIHVRPLDERMSADSVDFSFQYDVYGGFTWGMEGRDLPSVVKRTVVLERTHLPE